MDSNRLLIAIQKSGRLTEKSLNLLKKCGLSFNWSQKLLVCRVENFPLDIMFLRDDDIPEYVMDGICHLGIVGENVLQEKLLGKGKIIEQEVKTILRLGFGTCRLALATPNDFNYSGPECLEGLRIATSYPALLGSYLKKRNVSAEAVEISGSVEIAPTLKVADLICDLVSTGTTLRNHGLKEVETIFRSECVMAQTNKQLSETQQEALKKLLQRLQGVKKAEKTKYIMMNAPRSALEQIKSILPGMENPSILKLDDTEDKIAIHSVCKEEIFWETMEKLKSIGASSILVMPIEKIVD